MKQEFNSSIGHTRREAFVKFGELNFYGLYRPCTKSCNLLTNAFTWAHSCQFPPLPIWFPMYRKWTYIFKDSSCSQWTLVLSLLPARPLRGFYPKLLLQYGNWVTTPCSIFPAISHTFLYKTLKGPLTPLCRSNLHWWMAETFILKADN